MGQRDFDPVGRATTEASGMESKSGRLAAKAGCPLSGGAVKMERPQKRTIAGRNMFCFPKRMIASEETRCCNSEEYDTYPRQAPPEFFLGDTL